MSPGRIIRTGDVITIEGKEWEVTNVGAWGLRCERGVGRSHAIIVVPYDRFPEVFGLN